VSFLYAYEVSWRARAEEAGPTFLALDSPLELGSPAASSCIRRYVLV
jgi:hypothetical protein